MFGRVRDKLVGWGKSLLRSGTSGTLFFTIAGMAAVLARADVVSGRGAEGDWVRSNRAVIAGTIS